MLVTVGIRCETRLFIFHRELRKMKWRAASWRDRRKPMKRAAGASPVALLRRDPEPPGAVADLIVKAGERFKTPAALVHSCYEAERAGWCAASLAERDGRGQHCDGRPQLNRRRRRGKPG